MEGRLIALNTTMTMLLMYVDVTENKCYWIIEETTII